MGLLLAMANPLDYGTINEIKFRSGLDVSVAVATEEDIRAALEENNSDDFDFDLFATMVPSVRSVVPSRSAFTLLQ